jgi:hypothetical protein
MPPQADAHVAGSQGVNSTRSCASSKFTEGEVIQTADGDPFDVPHPWILLAMAIFKGLLTMLTVSGAFFFLLAEPEGLTPRCYLWSTVPRIFCTISTVAFWTFPVVCCMIAEQVFKRYLIDARTYYEFLLHSLAVRYPQLGIIEYCFCKPGLPAFFTYAVLAFSALAWKSSTANISILKHIFSSLAYLAPILSFVSVVVLNWTVEGNIIPLPIFLAEHAKAVELLNKCKPYTTGELKRAYLALEKEFELAAADNGDFDITTGRLVALLEEKLQTEFEDIPDAFFARPWNERMLTSRFLKDARSQQFRRCLWVYMLWHVLTVLIGYLVFFMAFVTALDLTKAVDVESRTWQWMAPFTLGTDHSQWQAIAVRAHIDTSRANKFLPGRSAFLGFAP